MKKLFVRMVLSMFFVVAFGGFASAAMIVDLYGDKDGLGLGLNDGESFTYSYGFLGTADTGTITDSWLLGDQTWTQSYDISGLGTVTSAFLEIGTGGQGLGVLSEIYLDGVLVGTLTDGDRNPNYYVVDTFDLMSFGINFDGANTLMVNTSSSGDGWALDYSELTFADSTNAPVPEPSTVLLFGAGLMGLVGYTRRKKK